MLVIHVRSYTLIASHAVLLLAVHGLHEVSLPLRRHLVDPDPLATALDTSRSLSLEVIIEAVFCQCVTALLDTRAKCESPKATLRLLLLRIMFFLSVIIGWGHAPDQVLTHLNLSIINY